MSQHLIFCVLSELVWKIFLVKSLIGGKAEGWSRKRVTGVSVQAQNKVWMRDKVAVWRPTGGKFSIEVGVL